MSEQECDLLAPLDELRHDTLALIDDGLKLRRQRLDGPSLILAHLRPEDRKAFHEARIGYSGEAPSKDGYGDVGPYIATSLEVLWPAIEAMGWVHLAIDTSNPRQWIVRRKARDKS